MRIMTIRRVSLVVLASLALLGSAPKPVIAGGEPVGPAWDDLPIAQPAVDDWPWWCGPNRDNVAAVGQTPPTRWSKTENET